MKQWLHSPVFAACLLTSALLLLGQMHELVLCVALHSNKDTNMLFFLSPLSNHLSPPPLSHFLFMLPVVSSFLLHLIFDTASLVCFLFLSFTSGTVSISVSISLHPVFFSPAAYTQCDQDQCIQSTKFVLQAATTPLLQQQSSEPIILTASSENGSSLPGRTSLTLGGPCTSLILGQPTPPTSTPSLSCHEPSDMLPTHGLSHTHNHSHPIQEPVSHHHFLTPEEVPSPPGMLPCGSPLGHSHTMQAGFYNPASQDSLHEDSVRGLVKLSSVWRKEKHPSHILSPEIMHPTLKLTSAICWVTSLSPRTCFPSLRSRTWEVKKSVVKIQLLETMWDINNWYQLSSTSFLPDVSAGSTRTDFWYVCHLTFFFYSKGDIIH